MPPREPVSIRLDRRLRPLLKAAGVEVPEDAMPRRTFVPRAELSNGSWTWCYTLPNGMPAGCNGAIPGSVMLGSQVTMAELLRAPELEISQRDRISGGDWTVDIA